MTSKIQTFKTWCCVLTNLASMFLFATLLALTVLWVLQSADKVDINPLRNDVLSAPNRSVYLNNSVILKVQTNKVQYTMWLEDERGHVVYKYPSHALGETKQIVLGGCYVEVPNINPGAYRLMTEVEYMMNPLKSAKVKTQIALIEVI